MTNLVVIFERVMPVPRDSKGHFFSVNEYFGAYNEETGEDILSDVGDTFDNADPLDQAGNQW